jgi:hypothetical protein
VSQSVSQSVSQLVSFVYLLVCLFVTLVRYLHVIFLNDKFISQLYVKQMLYKFNKVALGPKIASLRSAGNVVVGTYAY